MKIRIVCAGCGKDREALPIINSDGDLVFFLMPKCEHCLKQEGEKDVRGTEQKGN